MSSARPRPNSTVRCTPWCATNPSTSSGPEAAPRTSPAVLFGGDPSPASGRCPQRPAPPRLRSPLCPLAVTRCARLRRACDHR
ncbi:hypothetical protein F0402_08010 [Mycolicibacter arupensis]|uniref:Uncharacterized protein n=1 Tax=Mycolicibacter arupensis TaxID=342002 RepID=A0A5B1MGS8_9MYCO|nr:hypothetical protein F0402_08010 [Mycolicibacter arupensis]TXI60071.1 MAG: hypothetical protein E6Q54_01160 [Mycolicibacter arupensis]